ncbi:MAG: hypothetical protein BGP06_18580 [Rhizobiales bacterium 65-9]|nr:hypothetical protein [Hyphomicrobiales bacterium]OJY35000.1 MAG: hypothetical protein BGP06_18580 [Rhizobiales bacterium 65-9]
MAWTAADQDELAALRWRHSWLRCKLALLKLEIALRAYDPNQTRVPAGNPDEAVDEFERIERRAARAADK